MIISIKYGQFDPEAKADSTVSTNTSQSWAKISELTLDRIKPPNAMTCELNQTPLDGSMPMFPDNPDSETWGWYSSVMSDENCLYATPPTIDITFTQEHKSPGLTLLSYPYTNDYVREARCTWYDASGAVIQTGNYILHSTTGVIYQPVEGFRRIKLEVLRSSLPYRYVKMYAIEYGIEGEFTDTDINTASLLEEIDPISDTLSVNTLHFDVKIKNFAYSLITGDIEDNMLMKKQKMVVTGNNKPFGTFFLDKWKDNTGRGIVFTFDANDPIGVMGGYEFMGGLYVNEPVTNILDAIYSVAFPTGLIPYELDAALSSEKITGYIPISTCREALQQICFAIGATADDSRRDYVWIYRRDTEIEYDITLDDQYLKVSLEPTDYYSGVSIESFDYVQTTDVVTAQDGTLPAGQHTIKFSQPLRNLTISGGTIISNGVNYAIINVATTRNVVLTGYGYQENVTVYAVKDTVAAGEIESIAEFTGNTLINNANALLRAQDIFTYLKQRIDMRPEIRLQDREVGYIANTATQQKPIVGTIESLDINLRGNRASARIVGNVVSGT